MLLVAQICLRCAVDAFFDGNFFGAEVVADLGEGRWQVTMKDGGLTGVTVEVDQVGWSLLLAA